jgi:hypothetical protein
LDDFARNAVFTAIFAFEIEAKIGTIIRPQNFRSGLQLYDASKV